MIYPAVVSVFPLSDYVIKLIFANGEIKRFDMKPYLEMGIFQELKEENMFKTVRISFDTICWANDADIDPETLYHGGTKEEL